MDIRRLAAFVRVYETGSFTRAARAEFVSRQAVSKAVSQLEDELGPLFERRPRGVRPTGLADAVYPHARRAVEACAAIEAQARRYARGQAGRLLVALESNAALTLPLGLAAAYMRERPGVELKVFSVPGGAALGELASGRADAAIAGPPDDVGFAFEPVLTSTVTVVFLASALGDRVPHRDGPAGDRCVELAPEALAGTTVFGVAPGNHVERRLARYLSDRGIDADAVYDYADTMLATGEMEAGAGGVIVEGSAAAHRFGGPRYAHVPLTGPGAPDWQVGVVYRPGDPCAPVARDLAAFARRLVADEGPQAAAGWR